MLLNKQIMPVFDTLCYLPVAPVNMTKVFVHEGQTIDQLRVDNDVVYGEDDLPITSVGKEGQAIYDMMNGWDEATLMNAYFANNLEAGNIGAGGFDIKTIIIKKMDKTTDYKEFVTSGYVDFQNDTVMVAKDYLIESGSVYLYSLQPVASTGFYGMLQKSFAGLNDYEYSWIIDTDGTQLCVPDLKINSVSHVNKDTTFETIGSEFPYVNRSSRTNYRTFTVTGTIASTFDINGEYKKRAEQRMFGGIGNSKANEAVEAMVRAKYKEKRGEDYNHKDGDIYSNYDFERYYRDTVVEMLKNGKPKILKSDTEGLMKVKITNVSITPKQELGSVLCDFSATISEIGKIDEASILDFNLLVD